MPSCIACTCTHRTQGWGEVGDKLAWLDRAAREGRRLVREAAKLRGHVSHEQVGGPVRAPAWPPCGTAVWGMGSTRT